MGAGLKVDRRPRSAGGAVHRELSTWASGEGSCSRSSSRGADARGASAECAALRASDADAVTRCAGGGGAIASGGAEDADAERPETGRGRK